MWSIINDNSGGISTLALLANVFLQYKGNNKITEIDKKDIENLVDQKIDDKIRDIDRNLGITRALTNKIISLNL